MVEDRLAIDTMASMVEHSAATLEADCHALVAIARATTHTQHSRYTRDVIDALRQACVRGVADLADRADRADKLLATIPD